MIFNKSNEAAEEYELVQQDENIGIQHLEDDQTSHVPGNLPRNSSDSSTSVIFENINEYASKCRLDRDDDFVNNAGFQWVLQRYKGHKGFKKSICAGICILVVLVWAVGLIFYSNMHVKRTTIGNKLPNIIIGSDNVTLNAYNREFRNISMVKYRQGTYYSYRKDIRWLSPAQYPRDPKYRAYYLTRNRDGGIIVSTPSGENYETLIETSQFQYNNNFFYIGDIMLNPNKPVDELQNYHIVSTNTQKQWRHSSLSLYWLFNVETLEYTPIQPPRTKKSLYKKEILPRGELLHKLHFAEFSPKGNYIAFGCNHDLYVQDLNTKEIIQITDNGSKDIFNGKPDWIYEEEVTGGSKMFWWSPDEKNFVYSTLNDTLVKDFELDYYVKDLEEERSHKEPANINQYPRRLTYKYPKPGTANPLITLHNFNILRKEDTVLKYENSQLGDDYILYDGIWIDSKNFLMKQSDRTSKILSKKVFQPENSNKVVEVSSLNTTKEFNGWVEKAHPIKIIESDESMLNKYIDKIIVDGYVHVALFESATSPIYSKLLTKSTMWEVVPDSPIAYDKVHNFLYVLATMRSSMDSHLVGIDILRNKIYALTDIEKDGKYSVEFTSDGLYLNLIYEGPLQPWQKLVDMESIHNSESDPSNLFRKSIEESSIINYFENTESALKDTNVPTKIYKKVSIDTKDSNVLYLNVIEILPPNFNTNRKFPLLVHAYGGPGSQTVDKSFDIGFLDVVSASLDAIILVIDPRGTGGQGWSFMSYATDKIGYWEPRDLTTVVSSYISENKFISKDHVAIWGWSYGGFTTLKTLEYDAGKTFKFGMAVAPVTNWMFYDSIYTERYMNLPSKNPNYEKFSKINDFANFNNVKRFLIMHGSSDDNVHLQNTLWLVDGFDLTGVENYDLHIFPDSDHTIDFHNSNNIVYDKLLHWLRDAFNGRFDDEFI